MRYWAYAITAVFCLSFSYDLIRIPVQVHDSLPDIQEVRAVPSAAAAFMRVLTSEAYLRPLKAAQIRFVFDASSGHYTIAYRGVHVLLFVLTLWMFTRVLQVKTATDLSAALFALTVLLGLHTFSNLLREAYPINHYLEIVLFSLVVLNLAQGRPGWIADAAAGLIFAAAALIIESGLLIWVVIVAARLGGLRGISRRGVVLVSLLLCGYAYLRMFGVSTGLPALDERSSGFFLRMFEGDELLERFGQNPLPFYAYNVFASALSVLFSEPRAGVIVIARDYFRGNLTPWSLVAIVSSSITTILILAAAVSSWRDRASRDGPDRFFFVFAAVLVANAVLSYSYLKGDIVSVAGTFYALAAYAAVRRLMRAGDFTGRVTAAILCTTLLIASAGWATRTAGLHYSLRYAAFKTRNDWASVPAQWMETPEQRAVTERLRQDALEQGAVAPRFYPAWQARWFEE